ncbi:MAG: hydroxymethylbilane synthase [bacterium]
MVILGSRGSDLALWQARHVQQLLATKAQVTSRIEIIKTAGDQRYDISLARLEGKGFFTREIEEALLEGRIDLAVHSHKDLPTESPAGLAVVAVPKRGPAADCLVVCPEVWQEADGLPLREGAVVGSGSTRRQAQLLFLRPDLTLRDLRGNVPTRLRKLAQGEYDAIVLAEAGLKRLGLDLGNLRLHRLDCETFVPAPAQGALAIQMRAGDQQRAGDRALAAALDRLNDPVTARLVATERLLLASLEGGCHLPLGAHATITPDEKIELLATLGQPGGGLARCRVTANSPEAAARDCLAGLNAEPMTS